jgi:hypothetical protein
LRKRKTQPVHLRQRYVGQGTGERSSGKKG